jgi:hypothetical protein
MPRMSRYVQTLLVFQAGHCVLIHPIQQLRSPIGYPRGTTGTGPAVSTGNDARSASNEFSERTQHCVRRRIRQCLDHIDQRLQQIDHLVLALHQCQQRSHLRQQVGRRGTGGRLRGQSRKPLQLSASGQLQFWSGERVGHCPILRPRSIHRPRHFLDSETSPECTPANRAGAQCSDQVPRRGAREDNTPAARSAAKLS